MAAPTKTKVNKDDDSSEIPNKISTTDIADQNLDAFLTWCKESHIKLSEKVRISKNGSCAQYGMIAQADIEEGECLFTIPRDKLLFENTTSISDILAKGSKELQSESGWVPLLISLMYEYNNPQSPWRPYLDLVPDFKELNLPMFWDREEREKLLTGTGVIEAVDRDLKSINTEFNKIVLPFINKHPDSFMPICKEKDFYKKMVAFVMAYSFTEDTVANETITSSPMMVPVADILNSIAKNNAHLEFDKDVLKMVAIKSISKDEEIFNSYGEPDNAHLLQMYGYAEKYPHNHNDTVEIPFKLIFDVARETNSENGGEEILDNKWEYLETMEIVDEDGSIVIGMTGVLSDYECEKVIKILLMRESEFDNFIQEEDQEDSDDEVEENIFTLENIPKLAQEWKTILQRWCYTRLKSYPTSLTQDEKKLAETEKLAPHYKYSFYTAHSQKTLLNNIIQACNKG
ncbi:hypothetical protein LOTGIDRAFT_217400, partial [Lottia gigantea]